MADVADRPGGDRFTEEYRAGRVQPGQGTRVAPVTGPVGDWASDFSHLEPEWAADPYPIQDDLRQRCPIAHTGRFGGGWLPVRYEDVAAIAYDTENFSSRSIIMSNFRPPAEIAPIGGSPPISSDPPFHHDARRLLLPAFTKNAVTRLEPATRRSATRLSTSLQPTLPKPTPRMAAPSTRPASTRSTSRCG